MRKMELSRLEIQRWTMSMSRTPLRVRSSDMNVLHHRWAVKKAFFHGDFVPLNMNCRLYKNYQSALNRNLFTVRCAFLCKWCFRCRSPPSNLSSLKNFRLEKTVMSLNYSKEERKWRFWKEAEEKKLWSLDTLRILRQIFAIRDKNGRGFPE